MSDKKNTSGFDYVTLLQDGALGSLPSKTPEFPPLFDTKKKSVLPEIFNTEEAEPAQIAPSVTVRHFSKVFVIWKPWNECMRCTTAVNQGNVVLPKASEYTCPHIQTAEYKEIIDKGLQGLLVIALKEHFNLADGTRCVHVEWMEEDPESAKKLKLLQERQKETRVYPPDVEGAFNRGKEPLERPKN